MRTTAGMVGMAVARHEDCEMVYGEVISWDHNYGCYQVMWDDGSVETYIEGNDAHVIKDVTRC